MAKKTLFPPRVQWFILEAEGRPRRRYKRRRFQCGTCGWGRILRRFVLLNAVMIFAFLPCLLAQRGVEHSTPGERKVETPTPGSQADPELVNEVHHAVAVQPFGSQPGRFHLMANSSDIALQRAEALCRLVNEAGSSNYFLQVTILERAIGDAQDDRYEFLRSLSDSQIRGLKKRVRQLEKADSAVTKRWKTLSRRLKRNRNDASRIAEAADKLAQALEKFHTEQLAIGAEMGLSESAAPRKSDAKRAVPSFTLKDPTS